jgi:GntR family histidine utilization transcriptional repressor
MSSLHRRIGADIERRILSGEWPPGARVPTEAELQAEYGCARMTVSKALTDLSARGAFRRAGHSRHRRRDRGARHGLWL